MFQEIKHIAFATHDAQKVVEVVQQLFHEAQDATVVDYPQAAYRVGTFRLGGIQMQFCEPLEGDQRFSTYLREHGPGMHHICFKVDDIDETISKAQARGAVLQSCTSCGVVGSHVHPEGWVAFFSPATLPELQVELMQVYKPGEEEQYWHNRAAV